MVFGDLVQRQSFEELRRVEHAVDEVLCFFLVSNKFRVCDLFHDPHPSLELLKVYGLVILRVYRFCDFLPHMFEVVHELIILATA